MIGRVIGAAVLLVIAIHWARDASDQVIEGWPTPGDANIDRMLARILAYSAIAAGFAAGLLL